jgi:hypothetical protein
MDIKLEANESANTHEPKDGKMSVGDIQEYCSKTENMILAHGTTADMTESISEEGLLLKSLDHSTVVRAKKGMIGKTPVTEYTWIEPHSLGVEGCSLILEIPSEIIKLLQNKGLEVNQLNVFSLIYQSVTLTVTEHSYKRSNPIVRRPPGGYLSVSIPGGNEAKKLPVGATYQKKCIPLEFILGATTSKEVLFENKNRFTLLSDDRKKEIIDEVKERIESLSEK